MTSILQTSQLSGVQLESFLDQLYAQIEDFWEKPLTDKKCITFLEKLKPENGLN